MQTLKQFPDLVNLFQQKEQQIINQVVSKAKETAQIELGLFEFELFYSSIISKKKKQNINKWLKNYKFNKWKKALEKANGDEEKALFIYDEI